MRRFIRELQFVSIGVKTAEVTRQSEDTRRSNIACSFLRGQIGRHRNGYYIGKASRRQRPIVIFHQFYVSEGLY